MRKVPSPLDNGPLDLVIIGHVGLNYESSPAGESHGLGGAGYACARGAAGTAAGRVGLVSVVGEDHDPEPIRALGVDTRGVCRMAGPSARFHITQHADGSRSFAASLGVAAHVPLSCFPDAYRSASHVHVCTAPPAQQLQWLHYLQSLPGRRTISCDAFEHYARTEPLSSRAALAECDLRFANDEELELLGGDTTEAGTPIVVKHGSGGASYSDGHQTWHAPAPPVRAVDTTHAGEILAGVFLALRSAVAPPVALRHAVRAATSKVTQFGVDGDQLLRTLAAIRDDVGQRQGHAV
ncbi:carbohydrate kinase family protein [Spirillospora sp. NPDC049652]